MIYPSVTDLMDKVDSRYTLVVETAKRARQIIEGAKVLSDVNSSKPVTIAIHEIYEGRVRYERIKEGIK